MFVTDPMLLPELSHLARPFYSHRHESVLDRSVETNEAKARWELQLESHSFHLEEGDLITAEIIGAEVREFEASASLLTEG